MKKRRAWTTIEDDLDEQESAALAASVAAAKDRAAESGALLSSAKEDLTDHQRWLRAQSAAVERDRERHKRWLERQRDVRLASAKKERVRRHRRVVRQRALQAIRQAFVDLFAFFHSWIAFGFGKIARGLRFVGRGLLSAWRGLMRGVVSIARGFGRGLLFLLVQIRNALVATGRGLARGASWTGAKIGLAARGASAGIAAGASWSGAKAKASTRAGSEALSAGSQAVASEAGKFSRKAGSAIGSGLSATGHRAATLATTTGHGLASGASAAAARAAAMGASGGQSLSRALSWVASRAAAIPPKLYIYIARLGGEVQYFARVRAATPRGEGAEAQSPARDASQRDPAHTASVHVFESYGPHRDGTLLFGQPANDPWTEQGADIRDADAPADDEGDFDSPRASEVPAKFAAHVAKSSLAARAVAARTGSVLSSWGQGARERSGGLAARATDGVQTGVAWLGRHGARAAAAGQAGLARLAGGRDRAVAWGANWARNKGLDLSQMMIIAGAVLLLLGGLLVGGGLLLRSTSDPAIAAEAPEETFSKISWSFDEPELPLPDRAVFTLSGTPESFLINGISIAGVNNSGETLTGLEAALSPDVQRPDLRLDVAVEPQGEDADKAADEATGISMGQRADIPPGASFRLSFLFPPEATGDADGISVEDFFESYGGLLLKLRYDADGAERSVIQYLEPELLKTQLDEVAAQAGGS